MTGGGVAARIAAFNILTRVRHGQMFDLALDGELGSLPNKDRGLAHGIAAGVLRSRSKLDLALAAIVTQPWDRVPEDVKDVLRVGAFQIMYLDRVPAYAAVNSTVELAKKTVGRKGAPLVNAVLRKVSPGAGAPAECRTAKQLAAEYSHPEWLVHRWIESFGFQGTRLLLEHNNSVPPLTLVPAGTSVEELQTTLTEGGVECTPAPFGAGVNLVGSAVADLPGFAEGRFVVQDPAQAKALDFADFPSDGLIWDACAAPGGKSAVLRSRVARLISSDRGVDRTGLLRQTLVRTGRGDTPVVHADAGLPPFASNTFDGILIDAPCSATGTIRKHPDARWRLTESGIRNASQVQAKLLAAVAGPLKTGGILVYLTCSLEPEENRAVVDGFLATHPGFQRTIQDLSIFPTDEGTDGAYGARLVKNA